MISSWNHIKKSCALSCCVLLPLGHVHAVSAQEYIPLTHLLFEAYSQSANVLTSATSTAASSVTPSNLYTSAPEQNASSQSQTTIAAYLDSIAAAEAANGPFAQPLLEQYLSLGQAYYLDGQYEEAITIFENAEHISRINSGLVAAEQFVIVENLIASYLAAGELGKAEKKQQYLLFLSQQHFGADSIEAVPVLQKFGDWQMAAFNSGINNHTSFMLSFNSSDASPRELAFHNLYRAQNAYFQAISNLVYNKQISDPALPELELKLIETIFLGANRQGLLDDEEFYLDRRGLRTGSRVVRRELNGFSESFLSGRNAYERLRRYAEQQPRPDPLAVAQALLGLGDWYLLFNRRPNALKTYAAADAYLRSNNVAEDTITHLLHPEIPQQLPTFTPLPHTREKYALDPKVELPFMGYADVSFHLSRYGNVSDVEIDSTSSGFSKDMERRLRRIVQSSPFRPRLQQGKAIASEVNMRYYFTDIRTVSPVASANIQALNQ